MPNRIIREGIITSEAVNSLGWEAEVFYRRLLSVVDDFGRFDARPSVLRSALYPLKLDSMREDSVQRCLKSCEAARLVVLYSVEGKGYLEVTNFRQQVRSKKSKYPAPDGHMHSTCTADDNHVINKIEENNSISELQELHSTCVSNAQHMHTKTESETNTNTETNTKSETETNTKEASPNGSRSATAPSRSSLPSSPDEVRTYLQGEVSRCRLKLKPKDVSECALQYWADRSGSGWVDKFSCPVADWKANALAYALRWARNLETKSGSDPFPDSADLGKQF